MEYNHPSEIVKDLAFADKASAKIIVGVDKLTEAVKSTLGASGKCVIYEDAMGKPIVTKDGVTVANSVVLMDPVENIGATLIKEAAQKTVKEAGDGTTTSTVLAHSILKNFEKIPSGDSLRNVKKDTEQTLSKVLRYLQSSSKPVSGDTLNDVAVISTNNDKELGKIIADAYNTVGKDGVVLMEESDTEDTFVDIVEGVQFDSGLKSQHFSTDSDKTKAELENPYILIVANEIPNIRKIQNVLEFVIKAGKSLLIISSIDHKAQGALMMNKVKGNIKVNVVDVPGFGATKMDTLEDLATITGAKIINDELGDDLDMISPDVLGTAVKTLTDANSTVITVEQMPEEATERIESVKNKIKDEKNGFIKKKLEERLAMLSGAVGVIKVGANSKVELKEKKDRVEDAIYAVKAALKEGIVPGGGVALKDAANNIAATGWGGKQLLDAIQAPYRIILDNAGIDYINVEKRGRGIDVTTGKEVGMIRTGVVDPLLVTKTALKNAVSVAMTIVSAGCVISNKRLNESS
jgi:chaperonin GroEL